MKVRYNNAFPVQTLQKGPLAISKTYLEAEPVRINVGDARHDSWRVRIEAVQGDQRIVLNDLLPAGWGIREYKAVATEADGFCTRQGDGDYIGFPSHVWAKRRPVPYLAKAHAFSTLLHEAGHAREEDAKVNQVVPPEASDMLATLSLFGALQEDELGLYETYVIQPELRVNQFALDTILRLRGLGLDLEPGVSVESLVRRNEKALQTYRNVMVIPSPEPKDDPL